MNKNTLKDIFIGNSPIMENTIEAIYRAIESNENVLIEGEMGTGRELVAKIIHKHGPENERPLHEAKAVATTKEILGFKWSEFEKQAVEAMCLIKEVSELSKNAQSLLKQLLKSDKTPRFLSTTDPGIEWALTKNVFDKDLYDAIARQHIKIPPLRDRFEDIPFLIENFLNDYSKELSLPRLKTTATAMEQLSAYPWPGNVSELKHVVRRLAISATAGAIGAEDVDSILPRFAAKVPLENCPFEDLVYTKLDTFFKQQDGYFNGRLHKDVVEQVEKPLFKIVMKHTGNNQVKAAQILGLNRNTLKRRLVDYNLT